MSILVKGMKFPKNCLLCPCCAGEGIGVGRQYYCQAIDDEPKVSEEYRPKDCPIVGIPAPHGRLIDADKLKETIESIYGGALWTFDCFELINDEDEVPTIIEAENSSAIDDDVKKYCDYLKSETYDFCNRIENGEVSNKWEK